MRTVQMTLDDDLLQSVDRLVKELNTTRSAFARKALRDAIARFNVLRIEQEHRSGYERRPVMGDEFSVWEREQAWGDE